MYYRDDKFLNRFGAKLREVRKQKGFTQEELANEIGFPQSQIGRIERGEINTSLSHLAAIAKALNIPPKELLDF